MLKKFVTCGFICIIAQVTNVLSLELGPNPSAPKFPTRRALLLSTTAAALSNLPLPPPTFALDAEPSIPRPTALATLNLSILRSPTPRPLRIELFGDEAPASVSFFSAMATDTLESDCDPAAPASEICSEYRSVGVGYKNSQVWRLVPDRRIDFGRVDSAFSARIPPAFPVEKRSPNGGAWARPSTRGAVSVRSGGGAFEFTIAPVNNPALDKEDLVVVGRVLEEDLPFLDEIHAVPTRRDIVSIGNVPPLGSTFARACDFTSPDKTCAQFKPMKRIVVVDSSVVSLSSSSSSSS